MGVSGICSGVTGFWGGGCGLPSEVILPGPELPELCYVELLSGLIWVENSTFGGVWPPSSTSSAGKLFL